MPTPILIKKRTTPLSAKKKTGPMVKKRMQPVKKKAMTKPVTKPTPSKSSKPPVTATKSSVKKTSPSPPSTTGNLPLPDYPEPEEEWRRDACHKFQAHAQCTAAMARVVERLMFKELEAKARSRNLSADSDVFRDLYRRRTRDLIEILSGPANLQTNLQTGQLTPDQLINRKIWELCPQDWVSELSEYEKELTQMDATQQATCRLYTCIKCHQKETTYYELQTRSQDEPMTLFITCSNCGHHWKR